MASRRQQVLDFCVYVIVRTLVAIVQALPMAVGYAFARWLAWAAYKIDKRHRIVAEGNLRHAFGDQLSTAKRQRMVRAVYEHFARMIIEMVFIPRKLHVHNWKRFARLDNAADAVRAILSDRPTLIVTGHFGNWEMAGYLLAAIGMKSFAIARDLDNPYLNDFVKRFRQWSGQTILSKNGDIERIQQVLADRGLLISVGDQSAGPRGYFVDFFGRPASTHKAIAILAMKYDAQIIVGYGFRDRSDFHYQVGCTELLDARDYLDDNGGALALTQDFTRLLEQTIRLAPEQYLWLHNRWKHVPEVRQRPVRRAA